MTDLLNVTGLSVTYQPKKGEAQPIVYPLSLSVPAGKVIGVVGESGSGKSMTMKSLLDLLPDGVTSTIETFSFDGKAVQSNEILPISMIFQDPMTSLNPLRTIGYHLIEVVRRAQKCSKKEAKQLAIAELEKVGIPMAEKRMKQYPHELSGGMRQRVMIAMALLVKPKLLIADEPTTALDVTIQAQILALIKKLQQEEGLAVLLVTHDFGVVAGMCDFIKVMYRGHIVEEGSAEDIFYDAKHPYTKQLLAAAHLGDKHETTTVEVETFAISETYQQVSPTHRVWLGGNLDA
ncbi:MULTISPECIES: ABC transporter ATP-binding protein [Enterococcus]|uniref:ABC transporter domain-containing protein n=1 Tax=Enterococcus sulfureus ATCC 49903 TaxID=1140003 RepID=S0KVB9_9ENTE|nr:ABC transporter ATP-binding protein [Enterococcus sulfureus]EOT48739.1 hypothetical protein OMY_00695 [Enterococcus sulfureus ATCC 49903]EOT87631.1 hypothetical protein I573_00688 [Enterococcus sulfureus ATCC 49903]